MGTRIPAPKRIWTWLHQPEDIASLVAFRVLFGTLMLLSVVRFAAKGWIHQLYVAPVYHFKYLGFSWVKAWPAWGMYLHFVLLALFALLITLGLWYRLSALLFCLAFTYIELIDKSTYLNHYYLVSVLSGLMVLLPLHARFCIDGPVTASDAKRSRVAALWGRAAWRQPRLRRDTAPRWCLLTLRVQLALVYVFAGLAKLQPDWLMRAQPLATWLDARVDLPLLGPLLGYHWTPYIFSWAGALFDLTIPLWLSLRRTRPWAYVAVIVFHAMTGLLFNIGMFPWMMIAFTTVFFSPSWARRAYRRLPANPSKTRHCSRGPTVRASTHEIRANRGAIGLLALHFTLQLLLPLRHYLYAGNHLWTNEGFRFAWHVMVIEKAGSVFFTVKDRQSGQTWDVSPDRDLTPLQAEMMAMQPDMILEYAHRVADDFRKRGYPDVAVYADAYATLNGRPSGRLIDPLIDLATVHDGLSQKSWILSPNAAN